MERFQELFAAYLDENQPITASQLPLVVTMTGRA